MRYEQPPDFSDSELEAELASGNPERIAKALLSAFYSQEPGWIEARCLEYATAESAVVRRMVAIVLGNVSNIAAEYVRLNRIVDALSILAGDPDVTVADQAGESLSIAIEMLQRRNGVE
jgi:hypothetical protein